MLKQLFKTKDNAHEVALSAAVSGECVSLENVPDPVFSEKMIGDGYAIKPKDEKVVAPASTNSNSCWSGNSRA